MAVEMIDVPRLCEPLLATVSVPARGASEASGTGRRGILALIN